MSLLIRFEAYDPDSSSYTLYDAASPAGFTDPVLLASADWGNATWQTQTSGPRGTLGRRVAAQDVQDRQVTLPIRVYGTSMDNLAANLSDLYVIVDKIRRYGGRIVRRAAGQTYRQYLEVLSTPGLQAVGNWKTADTRYRMDTVFAATCAPYATGDPMDVTDEFDTDTTGSYTADAGALTNVTVTGGALDASANLATENRYIHTSTGYTHADHQATVESAPGATLTSFKAGVVLKRVDASNYLEVYVDDTGAVSRLRLDKIVATVRTNLVTTNLGTRVSNGTVFHVRGRVERNVVYAEYFTGIPQDAVAPTTSLTAHTMSTAEAAVFGSGVTARAGIVFTPQHTDAKVFSFRVRPYTYRAASLPEQFRIASVPGDHDALMDVDLTVTDQGAQRFCLVGWQPAPDPVNFLEMGDNFGNVAERLWQVAAVANINNAATSVAQTTSAAKYGAASLEVTATSGNSDSGASKRVYRRFRRGTTYTFRIWVQSATSTANVRARVGNSAANDTSTTANTALATSWQQLSVTWTPTADREDAYITVIRTTSGAADVFRIDAEEVYEGTTAPTAVSQTEGRGAPAPFGVLEWENTVYQNTLIGTASGTASAGFYVDRAASGNPVLAALTIDPNSVDNRGAANTVEVWGRIWTGTAVSTVTATAYYTPFHTTSDVTYTVEHGVNGRSITIPDANVWRLHRIGTLMLPERRGDSSRAVLHMNIAYTGGVAAGTAVPRLDNILLVNPARRAVTATGYPAEGNAFIPSSTGVDMKKVIASDLSTTSGLHESTDDKGGLYRSAGIGGRLLEIPPGNVDVVVDLSGLVPDQEAAATETTSDELAVTATVHFAVTPRWAVLRDA